MASSNRHWPNMFKSKTCNSHHHQWHHDLNTSLTSSGCHRTPYTSVSGCEERCPDPKPRWNPKPEQIRILEAIFNSGMVNPPRDEIRKIRAQLQEYGQVGDANVFYWFQNRKSRTKNKLRNLQHSKQQSQLQTPQTLLSSSSSSSSDKSSPKVVEKVSNSPAYFPAPHSELLPAETFFFQNTQGFCFSELSNVVRVPEQSTVGPCTSLLLSDIVSHGYSKKDQEKMLQEQNQCYSALTAVLPTTTTSTSTTVTVPVPSTISQIQAAVGESGEVGLSGPARSTVFINDMAFEVASGPFNVREAFGDDAVLINSSGQAVLTNEWGVTLHSLQHGAFYYLI